MKLLITGGTGFLGSVCVKKLAESNDIETLYLVVHKNRPPLSSSKIRYIDGDARNLEKICINENSIDACLIMSGVINGRGADAKLVRDVNYGGVVSALNFCKANNVKKIIFTSSINVKLPKKGAYASSKIDAEELIMRSGLDYLIFRPSLIYGNHCRHGLYVIEKAIRKYGIVPVFGCGCKTEQPIHVEECADFIVHYILSGEKNRVIELLGLDAMTYDEMCRAMAQCIGKKVKLLHIPAQPVVAFLKVLEAMRIKFPVSAEQIYHIDSDLSGDMESVRNETGIKQSSFIENYSRDGMCEDERTH